MRRVTRGVGLGGRSEYAKDEQRDGLGQITTLENNYTAPDGAHREEAGSATAATAPSHLSPERTLGEGRLRESCPQPQTKTKPSRAERVAQMLDW